jgi:hypothetical protein
VGKQEREGPLGKPTLRWEDNIRVDLGDIGWVDMDWIIMAHDSDQWRALVNSVINRLRVP